MKRLVVGTISLLAIANIFAAETPKPIRTISNIPGLPTGPLQRVVSPRFFKSLEVSPVEGWIAVRGILSGTKISSAKVVHSELGGAYDSLALALANYWQMSGPNPELGSHISYTPIMIHLLIYQIRDGKMALSFVHLDNPGGNQGFYYGHAWLAVFKNGKWVEIKPRD